MTRLSLGRGIFFSLIAIAGCGLDVGGLAPNASDTPPGGSGPPVAGSSVLPPPAGGVVDSGPQVSMMADGSSDVPVGVPNTGAVDAAVDQAASVVPPPVSDAAPAASTDGAPFDAVDVALDAAQVQGNDAGAPSDAGAPDAPAPPGPDASAGIPAGWTLVLYAPGAPVCPVGFAPHTGVASATVGADACSCGCTMTEAPSCASGVVKVGFGAQCGQAGASIAVTENGGCIPTNATLSARFAAQPLQAQGGACASTAQPDEASVTRSTVGYCDVPPAQAGAVAAGSVPAGFASCITTAGSVACPANSPFSISHAAEDKVNLTCSPCSACTFTATCSAATLSVFQDDACSPFGFIESLSVDGTCGPTDANGDDVGSVSYSASVQTTCTAGASTPALQAVNPRTICCQPAAAP